MTYATLATSDTKKLNAIEEIRKELAVEPGHVAIVYESTTFGIEACQDYLVDRARELELCRSALKLPLPVNIADVRYGLRQKAAVQAQSAEMKSFLPGASSHLTLEQGAENGSEFPESQQSPLTAASTELELQHLIAELRAEGIKLVVIIATDVRDRLFLIQQISSQLDGALFVDFGADRLLGHADFLHATRGVLTLSSTRLSTRYSTRDCLRSNPESRVWSTDEQASLACAIAAWSRVPGSETTSTPIPYVVSLTGLVSSDDIPPDHLWYFAPVFGTTFLCVALSLAGVIVVVNLRGAGLVRATEAVPEWDWAYVGVTIAIVGILWVSSGSLPLALLVGGAVYIRRYWGKKVDFRWSATMIWVNAALLLTTASLESVWGVRSIISSRFLVGDDTVQNLRVLQGRCRNLGPADWRIPSLNSWRLSACCWRFGSASASRPTRTFRKT